MITSNQMKNWIDRLSTIVKINNDTAVEDIIKVIKEMDSEYLNMISERNKQ